VQRLEDLELLVPHGLAVDVRRRLHRHEAEQLEQMVLHHVAECPGHVVVVGAALHSERLSHRDLHVVDAVGVPQRLEKGVGKPGDEQVLHTLLAEVVVDAEDLLLVEDLTDRVVDRPCGRQVVPDRLLEHHTGRFVDQAVLGETGADGPEQPRRAGEVEHPDPLLPLMLENPAELRPIRGLGEVESQVGQAIEEALDGRGIEFLGGDETGQLTGDLVAVPLLAQARAGDPDNAGTAGQLAVAVSEVQRGQELADGEITGSPEDDEVARFYWLSHRHGPLREGSVFGQVTSLGRLLPLAKTYFCLYRFKSVRQALP
jgi:hypothetical protein